MNFINLFVNTSKKLLIAATSLMSVAVIAAGASGTAAWFIANRTVKLNVSNIALKSSVGDLKVGDINFLTDNSVTGTKGNDSTIANLDMTGKYITATSSKTGKTHCKTSQTGNVVKFIDTTTGDTKSADYIQFTVELENYNTTYDQDVILDLKLCKIEAKSSETGNAYTMTRVAIDKLTSSNPAVKADTSAAVLMESTKTTITDHKWAVTSATEWELEKVNTAAQGQPAKYEWRWVTGKDPENPTEAQTQYGYQKYAATDTFFIPKLSAITTTLDPLGTITKATVSGEQVTPGSAYTVVTIWFEGTELLDQNANLPDIFNVNLAFTSSDKTTSS